MKISIDSKLAQTIPGFKIGVITYKNIVVGASPQMIKGRLQLYQESIAIDLDSTPLADFKKGIQEWRQVFKQLGVDPSKYRPSHEALLRRVAKRQFLTTIHSAADINNFFSMQYGIPIGIYDADKLNGDLEIRLGRESESYEGLNNREIDASGKLVSVDQTGPFGSPYVDAKRTAVTEETTSALQIVYLLASMESEEAHELLTAMSNMFTQVNGGIANCSIEQ
ncbi:B3/4 domain-containing protein [Bacillus pinisoli]|uniref:B3/B4 domain-containing protein n=1 Tax=Bacillus pinisoli TaxID=2901866 RepID=UPI001FF4FC6A|nr:phenylalanine--tRNA ligase beta subunit-related protein [Bacillus pinisoli]